MTQMVLDAGQIRIGYVDANNPGALLGATRGGAVFESASDIRDMPVDGAKGAVKGSERITRVTASIEATIIEVSSWVLRLALPGSQRANWPDVTPTHDELQRFLTRSLSNYSDSVALIAEVKGTTELQIVLLKNVIGKGGLSAAMVEGDEAGIKIKFEAHFNPNTIGEESWNLRSFVPPSLVLVGWWKGENNLTDSINSNALLASGSISYSSGFSGQCFNLYHGDLMTPEVGLFDTLQNGKWLMECYIQNPIGAYPSSNGVNILRRDAYSVIWTLASASSFDNLIRLGLPSGEQSYLFELPNAWTKIGVGYASGVWDVYFNGVKQVPISGYHNYPIDIIGGYYVFSNAGATGANLIDEIKILKE